MKFISFILLFYGLNLNSYGQNWNKKIDSLQKVLNAEKKVTKRVDLINEISEKFRYVQLDESLRYADEALKIAKVNDYKIGIAKANYNLGATHFYKGEYQKSIEFYKISLQLSKEIKNQKLISDTNAAITSVYVHLGEYNESLKLYNQILTDYTQSKNHIGIAQTYSNIGTVYYYQNEKKKALNYYLKSSAEFKKANYTNNHFNSTTLTNIGQIYFELKEYKKAEKFFSESAKINDIIGNKFMVAKNLCSLGDIEFEQRNLKKAEEYHLESLKIGKEMNNQDVIAYNHGDLGRIYLESGKEAQNLKLTLKGIEFLEFSTNIFKQNQNLNSYQQYTKYLAEAYKANGNYEKALEIFQEHILYKDSLFNEEKRREFTRTELSFEFAKREDSIRYKNEKEIAIRDATLNSNNRQKWLLFGGIFILSLLGMLLLYQNQSRKRTNQKLLKLNEKLDEANQIKTRFFNILNHDLRAPISNIIKFIRLQQNQSIPLDEITRKRLENQTINSAENLLVSMEDLLLWSKGQMQNFKPQPQNFSVDELFEDIRQYFENVENVSFSFINSEKLILFTDENYLKTILRNLTSNAINALAKTADAKIMWKAESIDEKIILSISDNGPGGTMEQFRALYDEKEIVGIKTGLGLHLVRDMAKSINCQIKVETSQGKGTTIYLKFEN